MNVLSLFDGMSCGRLALERAGIKVNNYYASEVDKNAIAVSKANWSDINYIGDVRDIKLNPKLRYKIDLLIGGSPCQSFSFAGKRNGMSTKCEQEILSIEQYLELKDQGFEFEGQSYLFWEYMRLLKELKPKYFLLENVKMAKKWKDILSDAIGCEPIEINSNLVSAQNRKRLYWTNIPNIEQPKDKEIFLKDILEKEVSSDFYLSEDVIKKAIEYNKRNKENGRGFEAKFRNSENSQKMDCIKVGGQGTSNLVCDPFCVASRGRNPENPTSRESGLPTEQMFEPRNDGKTNALTSVQKDNYICESSIEKVRKLTPIECERLQTIPDNYTAIAPKTQRYKMLGNGWTVDVIAHIFKGLK